MKTRKNLAIILLTALFACCVFGLIGCETSVHTHELEKVEAVAATCETAGNVEYYRCKGCNKYFKDDVSYTEITLESTVITELGHELTHYEAKAATCTEAGYEAYDVCTRDGCSHTTYTVIEALNHKNKVHHEKVEATCTEDGTIEYWHCPDCDKNFSDEACTQEVTELVIVSNGHEEVPHEAKAATCTEAGWNAYVTCAHCDYTTKQEIPATGHEHKIHNEKVDATCKTDGTIEYWHCSDCNKNFSDEACTNEVTKLTIDALKHDYTSEVTTKPTCTAKGVRTYTCKREGCGHTYTEDIAIDSNAHDLIHHEGKDSTCTEKGHKAYDTCSRCDYTSYEELPLAAHVYDQEVANETYLATSATCSSAATYYKSCKCGEKGEETFEHGDLLPHDCTSIIVSGDYEKTYIVGEKFDVSRLIVSKVCKDCEATEEVSDFTISNDQPLTLSDKEIIVSYGDLQATIEITVKEYYIRSYEVTDVRLEKSDDDVLYVIEGTYEGAADRSVLYFDLAGDSTRLYLAQKKDVTLVTSVVDGIKTFKMSAKVTNMSANGKSMYPHMHVNGKKSDLKEATGKWNGVYLETEDSKFEIVNNTDSSKFPFTMPVVMRTFTGTLPEDGSYAVEKVYLEVVNGRIYYVIEGTSENYTQASLSNVFDWRLDGKTKTREFLKNGVLTMDQNGNYKVMTDITKVEAQTNVRYTHIYDVSKKKYCDFNESYVTADKVDTESSFTVNGITYQIVFDTANKDKTTGYSTVGLKCTKAA